MEEEKLYPTGKDWSAQSSQVSYTRYDKAKKEMYVTFKSNNVTYVYLEVPEQDWKDSLVATSIGKFINSRIKKYAYKKLS